MNPRRPSHTVARSASFGLAVVLLAIPLLGASSDPVASASGSANAPPPPPVDPLSAAIFAGNSKAPTAEAWKTARKVSGVRMGYGAIRQNCVVEHVQEWVRVQCGSLSTGRVDLASGEKRDFSVVPLKDEHYHSFGENMAAVFSMHPGDRRIIQWLSVDVWWDVWHGDEGLMASGLLPQGVMFGAALQVDWSGPEPKMSLF